MLLDAGSAPEPHSVAATMQFNHEWTRLNATEDKLEIFSDSPCFPAEW